MFFLLIVDFDLLFKVYLVFLPFLQHGLCVRFRHIYPLLHTLFLVFELAHSVLNVDLLAIDAFPFYLYLVQPSLR